jgi:hypothetical protein
MLFTCLLMCRKRAMGATAQATVQVQTAATPSAREAGPKALEISDRGSRENLGRGLKTSSRARPWRANPAPRAPFLYSRARLGCPTPRTQCRRPWTCKDCSRIPASRSTTTRPVAPEASKTQAPTPHTRNPPLTQPTTAIAATRAPTRTPPTPASATRPRKRLSPRPQGFAACCHYASVHYASVPVACAQPLFLPASLRPGPNAGVNVWACVLRRQVTAMIGLGGAGVTPASTRNMPALQAFHRYGPGLQGLLKSLSSLSRSTSVPRERCGGA